MPCLNEDIHVYTNTRFKAEILHIHLPGRNPQLNTTGCTLSRNEYYSINVLDAPKYIIS